MNDKQNPNAGNKHEKAYMAAIRMAKEIMIHD